MIESSSWHIAINVPPSPLALVRGKGERAVAPAGGGASHPQEKVRAGKRANHDREVLTIIVAASCSSSSSNSSISRRKHHLYSPSSPPLMQYYPTQSQSALSREGWGVCSTYIAHTRLSSDYFDE